MKNRKNGNIKIRKRVTALPDSYHELLKDVSVIISDGRQAVVHRVNTIHVIVCWSIGRRIVEFYQQGNVYSILSVMRRKIKEREDIWNNIRPHEALGQLTPSQYFWKLQTTKLPTKNVIILQT